MTITEVENLSAAELKARRVELAKAAKEWDQTELAKRYIQARTDATMRDEKMAQQGQTITELQKALESANEAQLNLVKSKNDLEATVLKQSNQIIQLNRELELANAAPVVPVVKKKGE